VYEKENIEELFKNTFNNYEEAVRPEVWEQIASRIPVATPPAAPASQVAVKAGSMAGKAITGSGLWITGAAVLITGAVSYFVYHDYNNPVEPVNANNNYTETASPAVPAVEQDHTLNFNSISNQEKPSASDSKPIKKSTDNKLSESNSAAGENSGEQGIITDNVISSIPKSVPGQQNAPQIIAPEKNIPVKGEISNPENQQGNNSEIISGEPVDAISIHATETSGKAPFTAILWARGAGSDHTWNPGDGSADVIDKNLRHTYEEPGTYLVTLKAKDGSGKTVTSQVTLVVIDDIDIDIPNIFTPNQDGKNDVFTLISNHVIDVEATIFDKTGRKVFQWNGVDGGWNGKLSSGENAQEGTYFYHIFATGSDQRKHNFKGTIRLIR
jgi:gliding motility-associated-like protein